MLQQPELKLYEVAESVGYQNIGYFTGLFKRATGLSPKEYQRLSRRFQPMINEDRRAMRMRHRSFYLHESMIMREQQLIVPYDNCKRFIRSLIVK